MKLIMIGTKKITKAKLFTHGEGGKNSIPVFHFVFFFKKLVTVSHEAAW
jgi:hypothetical protein